MERSLYPLKFSPIYKTPVWGGDGFRKKFLRTGVPDRCGESWEISGVKDNVSVVCNGFLAGNDLSELLEVYMGDLAGDSVYERFGNEFPLLIKFIDAHDHLSVQVHPDDVLAFERHASFGKTEMWYIIDSEPDAFLISGFNRPLTKEEYVKKVSEGRLSEILNSVSARPGDVFFIPSGRVHTIGKGIMLAEIQQTSDITYRIYDYGRRDSNGRTRQLHTEEAVDAIDYGYCQNVRTEYTPHKNQSVNVADCQYFTTNVFNFDIPTEKDFPEIDSFIIYMCVSGHCRIEYEGGTEPVTLKTGETVLIPAMIKNLCLFPEPSACLLEIYIKEEAVND